MYEILLTHSTLLINYPTNIAAQNHIINKGKITNIRQKKKEPVHTKAQVM